MKTKYRKFFEKNSNSDVILKRDAPEKLKKLVFEICEMFEDQDFAYKSVFDIIQGIEYNDVKTIDELNPELIYYFDQIKFLERNPSLLNDREIFQFSTIGNYISHIYRERMCAVFDRVYKFLSEKSCNF